MGETLIAPSQGGDPGSRAPARCRFGTIGVRMWSFAPDPSSSNLGISIASSSPSWKMNRGLASSEWIGARKLPKSIAITSEVTKVGNASRASLLRSWGPEYLHIDSWWSRKGAIHRLTKSRATLATIKFSARRSCIAPNTASFSGLVNSACVQPECFSAGASGTKKFGWAWTGSIRTRRVQNPSSTLFVILIGIMLCATLPRMRKDTQPDH